MWSLYHCLVTDVGLTVQCSTSLWLCGIQHVDVQVCSKTVLPESFANGTKCKWFSWQKFLQKAKSQKSLKFSVSSDVIKFFHAMKLLNLFHSRNSGTFHAYKHVHTNMYTCTCRLLVLRKGSIASISLHVQVSELVDMRLFPIHPETRHICMIWCQTLPCHTHHTSLYGAKPPRIWQDYK